jgi:ATP dependent DNA ligase C terminal region
MVECRWLKPRLTAQIEYAEWTDGDHLRHSKFVALRDDRDVGVVRRELPTTKKGAHPRRAGFSSIRAFKRARKSLLSACSAGDFPFEASQLSKSLIRTLCST